MAQPTTPAVVLLSGGLDSATVLAIAKKAGYAIHAISFRYGQKHSGELARAQALAQSANVAQHIVVDIDLSVFGGSALTDKSLVVPKSDSVESIGKLPEIDITMYDFHLLCCPCHALIKKSDGLVTKLAYKL